MVLLAALLAGLDTWLAPDWRMAVLALAALVGLALVGLGLTRLRLPRRAEAIARIDARLPGRPLAALRDRLATGTDDPATAALWDAHLQRMAAAAREARPVAPDLNLAARDPFGLRLVALLLLATAVLFAPPRAAPGAGGTSRPGQTLAAGPAWEGWVEPPAYTSRPTLYLADLPEGPLDLLTGTRVTLRLYGDDLQAEETVSQDADGDSFTIAHDGRIAVGDAAWQVTALPDRPPAVSLQDAPEIEGTGRMRQPFHASDDFGVTAGTARFTLDLAATPRRFGLAAEPDPRDPLIVDLPLPYTGDRTAFDESLTEDFSQHPFANLPVQMTLQVKDALGQTGTSETIPLTLPGRRFFQPVARAVIEQRRDLLWSRANAPRVLDLLRAIANRPDDVFRTREARDALRDAIDSLALAMRDDRLEDAGDDIAAKLWDAALELEEGALADALERLERAQERLRQAMRDGASPGEIADLMAELRAATDDWLDLLAQQAEPAPDTTDQPQGAQSDRQEVTGDEIQALMDRIQDLMEEGRMDEAQALMQQLDALLRNLEMQQGEGGAEGRTGPGRQQMQDLQDTTRGQQDLADDAFRELQDRFNGRNDEGAAPDEQDLAARQQALRDELERLQQSLPGLTGEAADAARGALDRAGEAMGRAESALAGDDLPGAIDAQAEALEALRDGMAQLGRALAENDMQSPERAEGYERAETGRPVPARRDPLGRQIGESGRQGSDAPLRAGPDVTLRAQELLEELRRRLGERSREADELDYLDRLLERF